jgi:hypothetical protein
MRPQVCDALEVVYVEEALRRHDPHGRSSAGGGGAAAAAEAPLPSAANNVGAEPMSEGSDGGNGGGGGGGGGGGLGSDNDDEDGRGGAAGSADDSGSEDEAGRSGSDNSMSEQSSEDEDRDMLVECGVRQGKWERHEAELAKVGGRLVIVWDRDARQIMLRTGMAEMWPFLIHEG